MAEDSPLSPDGNLTEYEYEQLMAPLTPDGLIGHPTDPAPVSLSGGQVIVAAGLRAVVRGFPWYSGPDPLVFNPSLAGAARTDLVVLRLDRPDGHKVKTVIRAGTPGNPAPLPNAGTGPADLWEFPLAEYDVSSGALTAVRRRAWYLGDDGAILCTKTPNTRPPARPGRIVGETDTGKVYRAASASESSWGLIADDSGKIPFPLDIAWRATYQTVYRLNGRVDVAMSPQRYRGDIASGATVTLGALGTGFKPAYDFESGGYVVSTGARVVALWRTTGAVSLTFYGGGVAQGAYVNLDPVSFVVGS